MTPEQATFLMNIYLPQAENEQKITRRLIAAIPTEKADYTPHETSMTAWKLAEHIVSSDLMFLNGIANGAFDNSSGAIPESVKTPEQLMEWYDENFAAVVAKIRALTPEQLTRNLDFHGVFSHPAIVYMTFSCNHVIHHRGQLSAYLRPMGAKVPRMYGGSADEPFEMPATA